MFGDHVRSFWMRRRLVAQDQSFCSPTSVHTEGVLIFLILIAGSSAPASVLQSSRNQVPGFPREFSEGSLRLKNVKKRFSEGSLKILRKFSEGSLKVL